MLATELSVLFARDLTNFVKELNAFPDTASLWKSAPGVNNSAGTIALHIEGNLREYIGWQLGQIEFKRDRSQEFSTRDLEQGDIIDRVLTVSELVQCVILATTPMMLDKAFPEPHNGKSFSTRQFLIHLLGHLNYHLGQIDYLRRFTTGAGTVSRDQL